MTKTTAAHESFNAVCGIINASFGGNSFPDTQQLKTVLNLETNTVEI